MRKFAGVFIVLLAVFMTNTSNAEFIKSNASTVQLIRSTDYRIEIENDGTSKKIDLWGYSTCRCPYGNNMSELDGHYSDKKEHFLITNYVSHHSGKTNPDLYYLNYDDEGGVRYAFIDSYEYEESGPYSILSHDTLHTNFNHWEKVLHVTMMHYEPQGKYGSLSPDAISIKLYDVSDNGFDEIDESRIIECNSDTIDCDLTAMGKAKVLYEYNIYDYEKLPEEYWDYRHGKPDIVVQKDVFELILSSEITSEINNEYIILTFKNINYSYRIKLKHSKSEKPKPKVNSLPIILSFVEKYSQRPKSRIKSHPNVFNTINWGSRRR